jgi:hypothetical protein
MQSIAGGAIPLVIMQLDRNVKRLQALEKIELTEALKDE